MKRIYFLLILLTVSLFSNAQVTQVIAASAGQTYFTTYDPVTNPSGWQAILVIGDSKAAGVSTAAGPTPTAGTVKQYQRSPSAIIDVGASDLLYLVAGSSGSQWPRFGIDFYNNSVALDPIHPKIPVIVKDGISGSFVYHTSSTSLSWGTNGTLYSTAKTHFDAALALIGVSYPKAVSIQLGDNDFESSEPIANVIAGFTSIIDRVNADYNSPPIYMNIPHYQILIQTARYLTIKQTIYNLSITYPNVHILGNETGLWANGYFVDEVHWTTAGNQIVGSWIAAYMNSTESDKDVRRVLNSTFPNALTTNEKAAWKVFILKQKTAGRWLGLKQFICFDAKNAENALVDITGLTAARNLGSASFTADIGFTTNGSSTYLHNYLTPASHPSTALDNLSIGLFTGTTTTAAGTAADAYGQTTGGQTRLGQDAASRTVYSVNAASTPTYATDTKVQSDKVYSIARTSSSLTTVYKEGVSTTTFSTASTGLTSGNIYIGCRGTTPTAFYNGEWRAFWISEAVGWDHADFAADIRTLTTNKH